MPVFHGYFGAEVVGRVTALGGLIFVSRGRVHSGGRESVIGTEVIGCCNFVSGSLRTSGGAAPAVAAGCAPESVIGTEVIGCCNFVGESLRNGGGAGPAVAAGCAPDRVAMGRNFFSFGSELDFAKACGESVARDVASIADARQKRLRFCFMKTESFRSTPLAVCAACPNSLPAELCE